MAACFVVLVAGMRAANTILIPVMIAVFLAVISMPLMFWLQSKGVRKPLAVIATVLTDVSVLVAIGFLVGTSVNDLTVQLPKYQTALEQIASSTVSWVKSKGVPVETADFLDAGAVINVVRATVGTVAALAQNTLLVLLTTIFILFEAAYFPAKLRAAMGRKVKAYPLEQVTTEVQRYLVIKTLISIATGTLVGVWVAFLGVDFPVLWGLVAFIMNYIPSLGSILASVPPTILALLEFGPARAFAVAIGFLAVNLVFGNFLEPNLMGRRFGLSTLVVFLSLLFWGWVWGPVGMLLSVPLTMIVKIMLENTEELSWVAVLLGPSGPPRQTLARAASSRS